MPEWVLALEAAKEWGMAPWVIEEEAPYRWMERWRVMREEMATYQSRQTAQKSGSGKSDEV